MTHFEDTNSYEKKFLEKYLKEESKKKISILSKKIDESKDQLVIMNYKLEINEIRNRLTEDLNLLTDFKKDIDKEAKYSLEKSKKSEESFFWYNNLSIPYKYWNFLYEYQKVGVMWLIDLFHENKGGILADEMGLGKTVQIVIFTCFLYYSRKIKNSLILCPATIVSQWVKEFEKIAPDVPLSLHINDERGVVIVGYDNFKNSYKNNVFGLVILDEGHKIKNKDAQITIAVKKVKCNKRYIITGTPIQNNLAELWSIYDFVAPGLLGSYSTFQEEFESKIKSGKSFKDRSYHYSLMLKAIIEPHILRRMKSEIDHKLPSKIDKVVFLGLTPFQHELYIKVLESKYFKNAIIGHGKYLQAIDLLRKICNHPLLFNNKRGEDRLNNYCSLRLPNILAENFTEYSSKLDFLIKFVQKWRKEGNKVLIFSQSSKMLEIVENSFQLLMPDVIYLKMTGETSLSLRQKYIHKFNNDLNVSVFLLTTRVGGLGLNLVSANRIILYDPDWNPSTDNQAKERVYRFGQTSNVEIYRLVCKNTIEEKIYQKQIYKDCLSKKILFDPSIKIVDELLYDIFDYHQHNGNYTETDFENNFRSESFNNFKIKDHDTSSFYNLKEYGKKSFLNGKELLNYIEWRDLRLE